MSDWWALPMMISGGLFVGGGVSIAWERVPVWRETDLPQFRSVFAHTLRRVDRLQPALLAACLASTIGFAASADGLARTLAASAAAGFFIVLVGSLAWLVPLQRQLAAPGTEQQPSAYVQGLRSQWFRGHLIRTVLALALFILAGIAAVV